MPREASPWSYSWAPLAASGLAGPAAPSAAKLGEITDAPSISPLATNIRDSTRFIENLDDRISIKAPRRPMPAPCHADANICSLRALDTARSLLSTGGISRCNAGGPLLQTHDYTIGFATNRIGPIRVPPAPRHFRHLGSPPGPAARPRRARSLLRRPLQRRQIVGHQCAVQPAPAGVFQQDARPHP